MHESHPFLLSGRIVLPDGGARQRYILIADGSIRWISRSRPPAAFLEGVHEIVTGPQDWVFPGLIDLHTHASYNVLPLWSSPRAPFDNRHVWRRDSGYRAEVRNVSNELKEHWEARKVFSELQAVAGGTTLLEEPRPLDTEEGEGTTILCRDTGNTEDLGLAEGLTIRSVVDFFRPDAAGNPAPARGYGKKPAPLDAYVEDREHLQATLVHLAEGRSGFGTNRGVDPYSRAEFEALMAHPAMKDLEAVRASRLSLVHGCGIDVDDPAHIDFLTERSISVIWSPASNMLLYDDTIDVESLINRGVTVALGSDWSPSGSKHVWDEAKFARFFLNAIGSHISDADVFKMVTTNPGHCLGLPRFGRIEVGAAADLFIVRSPIESDNALEVFFSTTDRHVLATVVDGLPIYGDREFLTQFGIELQPLPAREGTAVANKTMHLPKAVDIHDFAEKVDRLEDHLKALDPPVLRSNLLAESDMPYRRRFQELRARVERFGWSVKQWKKKGSSPTPGRLPVQPDSAWVRVGFRSTPSREAFATGLGATVIPASIRLGRMNGLTAYLCVVTPEESPKGCPDEATLMFFASPEAYLRRSDSTLGGRTLKLVSRSLHRSDPTGSQEGFATAFLGEVAPGEAYFLIKQPVDWHHGDARVSVLHRDDQVDVAGFRAAVTTLLNSLASAPQGRDGFVASVANDYLVLWEHAHQGRFSDLPFLNPLAGTGTLVIQSLAATVGTKATFSQKWDGFKFAPGDCVRINFERRDLFPW